MFIYYLLHQLYRPLRNEGYKKMAKGIQFKNINENLHIDFKPFLKDLEYEERDNLIITKNHKYLIFPVLIEGTIYGNDTGTRWILRHDHIQSFLPNPIKFNEDNINIYKQTHNENDEILNLVVFINNNANNIKSTKAINLCDLYDYLVKRN